LSVQQRSPSASVLFPLFFGRSLFFGFIAFLATGVSALLKFYMLYRPETQVHHLRGAFKKKEQKKEQKNNPKKQPTDFPLFF
jgi:hypothetical protein